VWREKKSKSLLFLKKKKQKNFYAWGSFRSVQRRPGVLPRIQSQPQE
jgi:hypothetical protein